MHIIGSERVAKCEKETIMILQTRVRKPHHQIDTKIGGLAKVIKCSFWAHILHQEEQTNLTLTDSLQQQFGFVDTVTPAHSHVPC